MENNCNTCKNKEINAGTMLNGYPDSIGDNLSGIAKFLNQAELKDVFQSLYILPSVFNTDLDRGFSVIDYEINEMLASQKDFEILKENNISFKFDFILNHSSVLCKQFQDILKNGENSQYKDFFIDWNKFWDGKGDITSDGYIQPNPELIKDMFFRKPGLPILNVRMPDGKEVPYWNTFYQEVKYESIDAIDIVGATKMQYIVAEMLANKLNEELKLGNKPKDIDFGKFEEFKQDIINFLESRRKYLGQMDLNIKSPLVWEFYEETLAKLSKYGAEIVRLDAFAYAPKEPGLKNFLNDPGTWDLLDRVKKIANKYELTLLPEIHSKYSEKIHEKICEQGYITYDFFLPGLIIDAFERQDKSSLLKWIDDIQTKNLKVVNMLGCHDGIPLLDLKGLLSDEQIDILINTVVSRGGYVKDLHGQKNMYYQVNATYYSALGEDDAKLLLARAIQMFMPGKPQIWYLDIFAGKNNHAAVEKAGSGGHKEINRTNLSLNVVLEGLNKHVVKEQLKLIKLRNTFPAFGFDANLKVLESESHMLKMKWEKDGHSATLEANLREYTYSIVTDS